MPGCKPWRLKRPINSFEAANVCCHDCMQTHTLRCNRRHVLSRLQTCILQCVVTNVCRGTLCDAAADMCCHDCRRAFCDVLSRLHADVHFAMQPLTCVITTAFCNAVTDTLSRLQTCTLRYGRTHVSRLYSDVHFAMQPQTPRAILQRQYQPASQLNKNCLSFSSRITVKKR